MDNQLTTIRKMSEGRDSIDGAIENNRHQCSL